MEEIIARKKRNVIVNYISLIVAGAVLIGLGMFLIVHSGYNNLDLILLIWGITFLAIGMVYTIWLALLPNVYIKFKDGKFIFSNGLVCSPSEVNYCISSAYGLDGLLLGYGTLKVSVGQNVYKLRFVARVKQAEAQINSLKSQYFAMESVQREIAARNAEKDIK